MILTALQCDSCSARVYLHSIEIRIRTHAQQRFRWTTVTSYGQPDRDYCPTCTRTRQEKPE